MRLPPGDFSGRIVRVAFSGRQTAFYTGPDPVGNFFPGISQYRPYSGVKPVFFVAILFQTIDTAKEFDYTQILTRGGPGSASETLSIFTYLNSFGFLKMGYGSASAIILSVFIFLIATLIIKAGGIDFDK